MNNIANLLDSLAYLISSWSAPILQMAIPIRKVTIALIWVHIKRWHHTQ